MPSDIITRWMNSKKYSRINGIQVRPKRHPIASNLALSVQRGQADTYFLEANDGSHYVLKKFLQGKFTGTKHLKAVSSLLPKHPAFESGTKRQILTPASLNMKNGYHTKALAKWLNNTILMPKVQGLDWSTIIDKLRNESIQLKPSSRLCLCKNLTALVILLESKNIAHRDLSGGNVFIHTNGIKLIDFDSIYHPSLTIPNATTIGSEGYIAPFVSDDSSTWNSYADRFALTILNIELLILDKNSPDNHEGGIFDQEDIYNRTGKTISHAENTLRQKYPQALKLLDAAINSDSFDNCPKPIDWLRFCYNPTREINIKASQNIRPKLPYKKNVSNTSVTDIFNSLKKNSIHVYPNRRVPMPNSFQTPIPMDDWVKNCMKDAGENLQIISKSVLKKSRKEFSIDILTNPNIKLPIRKPVIKYDLPDNPWEI